MNFQKSEPEKYYDQSRYHINKVLFIVLHKVMTTKILLFRNLSVYVVIYVSLLPLLCFISSETFLKEKALYFNACNSSFSCFLNKGSHIFILQ